MGAHPRGNLRSSIYVRSEKQKAFHVEKGMTRSEEGGFQHISLFPEAHDPIMAPPSAARRGRGAACGRTLTPGRGK